MKSCYIAAIVSLSILCLSAVPASAESLAQKKAVKRWEEDVKSNIESANSVCGKSIAVEMDSDSVWNGNVPEDQIQYSMGAYCGNGCLFGVELICRDELGKEAVAEKIDKIVCKYQSDDTPKISIDTEKKTMSCSFSYRNMQFQDDTKEQLEKQL